MTKNTYNIRKSIAHLNQDLNSYHIQPDINYLLSILNVRRHSRSIEQDEFVNDLEKFYANKGAIVERDEYGNLYVTKGNALQYPCVVAHTDINQSRKQDVSVIINKDIIFGFDNQTCEQAGIGADDGCGIALAYEMFERFDNIKLFFPKDEEIGLVGTNACDTTFFSDCTMLLQGDRRSYTTDLITYTNGIETCSKEFVDAASGIMTKYGYSENRGVCTDIGGLKKDSKVDCIACNISIGYYNEHSDEEVISMVGYYNAVNFVYDLIFYLGDTKWHHIYTPSTKSIFDEYDMDTNGWSRVYYPKKSSIDWEDERGKQYDLFDELHQPDSKLDDPFGYQKADKYMPIDKEYDDYVCEVYANFIEPKERENLISQGPYGQDLKTDMDQDDLDSIVEQNLCPYCYEDIHITNSLLLNLSCGLCGSVLNSTAKVDFPNEIDRF